MDGKRYFVGRHIGIINDRRLTNRFSVTVAMPVSSNGNGFRQVSFFGNNSQVSVVILFAEGIPLGPNDFVVVFGTRASVHANCFDVKVFSEQFQIFTKTFISKIN